MTKIRVMKTSVVSSICSCNACRYTCSRPTMSHTCLYSIRWHCVCSWTGSEQETTPPVNLVGKIYIQKVSKEPLSSRHGCEMTTSIGTDTFQYIVLCFSKVNLDLYQCNIAVLFGRKLMWNYWNCPVISSQIVCDSLGLGF